MRNTLWQRLAARGDLEKAAPVQGSEEAQNLIPPVLEDNERGPTIQNNEEPHELTLWVSIIVLLVVTAMVGVAAEALVDSIDGFADTAGISKEFIGLILLPIVGNAAEHVTAVTSSVKDKIMLSISVAVGSSIVSSLLPFRYDTVNSLPSSKSPYSSFHSPSSLAGPPVIRFRCSLTRSSCLCSSALS